VRLRPGGLSSGASPDRLDALVYAVTELLTPPRPEPRIRSLDTPPLSPLFRHLWR
jgi:phage terminase large subunit-like protein